MNIAQFKWVVSFCVGEWVCLTRGWICQDEDGICRFHTHCTLAHILVFSSVIPHVLVFTGMYENGGGGAFFVCQRDRFLY
jgi:hypothetical protein